MIVEADVCEASPIFSLALWVYTIRREFFCSVHRPVFSGVTSQPRAYLSKTMAVFPSCCGVKSGRSLSTFRKLLVPPPSHLDPRFEFHCLICKVINCVRVNYKSIDQWFNHFTTFRYMGWINLQPMMNSLCTPLPVYAGSQADRQAFGPPYGAGGTTQPDTCFLSIEHTLLNPGLIGSLEWRCI
jgi:hypothetical protein